MFGVDAFDAVVMSDGGDWGVIVGSWAGSDPANDGGSYPDWAHVMLLDDIWVNGLFFLSFFCILNVVLIWLANSRE